MVPMRRWISLSAVAALLAVSGAFETRGNAQSGPRLQLGQREWDFGQIWTGDPCKTEIELKNVGDATLKILDIKSSCGCAAAEPGKRELAVVCGKIEAELVGLDEDERGQFMSELGIATPAVEQVIKKSYALLGLISFITATEPEARA